MITNQSDKNSKKRFAKEVPVGLNNDKVVISDKFNANIHPEKLDDARNGFLRAWFSTPIGVTDPVANDVCGVHLSSVQGSTVLIEKTGLADLSFRGLRHIAKELAESLPKSTFAVTITTLHDDKGTNSQHVITKNARTMLEAIAQAIIYVASEVYNESPNLDYEQAVLLALDECLRRDELLAVKLSEGGKQYTVTAITETDRHDNSTLGNLV